MDCELSIMLQAQINKVLDLRCELNIWGPMAAFGGSYDAESNDGSFRPQM